MKKETVLKVLKRYVKGLNTMYVEELNGDYPKLAEHYKFDIEVFTQAIKIIENERSNT